MAVVFDVGETLVDDTREWPAWADWLSVPPHTLSALVGAVVAQGLDNSEALRLIRTDEWSSAPEDDPRAIPHTRSMKMTWYRRTGPVHG